MKQMSANSPNRRFRLKRDLLAAEDQLMKTIDNTSRGRRDRGNTLPELLVAMVLMGFAVSAVIGGIRMVISASTSSDSQAKTEAVLTSAADRLTAADYVACPGADFGSYLPLIQAAAGAVSWDEDRVRILSLEYWDSTAGGTVDADGDPIEADGDWRATNSLLPSECNADINFTTSRTLQKLTIESRSPDDQFIRTIEVVKSPLVADPESP
jgi:prepilin-type N-terminal cleavage/methylation domain-containing protein